MYEITIKKTEARKQIIGKRWAKIGQVEKPRDERYHVGSKDESKTYIADEMGYTPEVESTETETTTVLVQNVDNLDLSAVIKAINRL